MKIICLIDSLGSGGAQRQLVYLALGFKERGHDVVMLTYHGDDFFLEFLLEANIDVICVSEPNYLKRLFKIRSVLRDSEPDVVLSFLTSPSFIATCSGFPIRNWRLVVGERDANPNITKSFKSFVFRFFHIFVDSVVSNSRTNIDLVRKVNPLLPREKLKVIYNIVNLPSSNITEYIKERNHERLLIVVAATHQRKKNAIGLLKAIMLLPERIRQNVEVDWYGEIREQDVYNEAMDFIKDFGLVENIRMHLPTKDIVNKFKEADVVGLFSFYEGLPNAICEAMMLGKPIMSSNVSDLSFFIDKKLLFNPHDINEIAASLFYVYSLDHLDLIKIGNENYEKAIKYFGQTEIIDSYLELFTDSGLT